MATLYHWDLPAALDDRGGWLNPDIAHWFADYAALVFRKLDGRVKRWATLNEPWVVVDGGYLLRRARAWAPQPLRSPDRDASHGAAVRAYRAEGRHEIGLVVNLEPKYAASGDGADLAATARSSRNCSAVGRFFRRTANLLCCRLTSRSAASPIFKFGGTALANVYLS